MAAAAQDNASYLTYKLVSNAAECQKVCSFRISTDDATFLPSHFSAISVDRTIQVTLSPVMDSAEVVLVPPNNQRFITSAFIFFLSPSLGLVFPPFLHYIIYSFS